MIRAVALFAIAIAACTRPAPDATPEGAVRTWLDRMEASDDDPRAIRDAYALLGPDAKANLEERAARASRLEGHRVEPWDMLAEGRFALKFRPKGMNAKTSGDTAVVEVTGDDPLSEHALVHCVRSTEREGASDARRGWRVEPSLPPVPPLAKREPDPRAPKDDSR